MIGWKIGQGVESGDLSRAWASCVGPDGLADEIGEDERALFLSVVSTSLTPEQAARVVVPARVFPEERAVLAVHWHPEFVPMDLIARRIEATFPNKAVDLIIPTQHNQLLSYGAYSGAEVDCYASGFNQKIQLLIHFENARLETASALKSMLAHTFTYRAAQLFAFLDVLIKPENSIMDTAVRESGGDEALVEFVRIHACCLARLLDEHRAEVPPESIKNRIVADFFDGLRPRFNDVLINRAKALIREVKGGVRAVFPLKYFYRATEIIEEVRALGGGVVIPHPEQFWPVLLARYDVDGVEVWTPESQRYTDFLIRIISEKNQALPPSKKRLLVFMGDDCHMGEKVREPGRQNPVTAGRQIGVQPSWEDAAIRASLRKAGMGKTAVIAEYKARLAGAF